MLPSSQIPQIPQVPQIPQIPQVPQIPQISPVSSAPQIKLSQLAENLISNTGSAPAEDDVRACSELPLDLEKLKIILELLIQDTELLSFLVCPNASKSLSNVNGLASFGIKCEDTLDNVRELYLVYYGLRDGRPVLLKEMLISVSQLISCKVQRDRDCLSGKDLHSMNLSGIHIHQGNLCETNLRKTNLSNSTLYHVDLKEADLRGSSFEDAIMNEVQIQDAQIDEHTNFTKTKMTLFLPKQLTPLKLFRLLVTIIKMNDDYNVLKIDLIHQIIHCLKGEIPVDTLDIFLSFIEVQKNPIYLKDKQITLFITENILKLNASLQQVTPLGLYRFLAIANNFSDDHKVLKIKLVHQIIDWLESATNVCFSDVREVFSNLPDLLKTPVYFEEEKIISFIAERFFKLNASPRQLTPARLYRFLTQIHTIHPAYAVLKIKLVHQIIDSLKSATNKRLFNDPEVFSKSIQRLKDPIYLRDKKITSFIAEKFLNLEGRIPEPEDLLRLLRIIRRSDQKTQQDIIRKSTSFVIRLMLLCSELCEDEKKQPGIPMLHQLIDCLNDTDISDNDDKFLTILLNHPHYVGDEKIMLFMASQLIKRKNFSMAGFDSLFSRKIVDCLSQKKFTPDCTPLVQLTALYAQSCSEIAPEFSINILFHAIETFQVKDFSNCRNVLWDTLLTSPIYLQNPGIFKLIRSKFINTKMTAPTTSGHWSEVELKLQFLLNIIHGLTPEDQKKFMLNNNRFFVWFVEWCTREGTPVKIIRQVETLYAIYLALPELKGAADAINERHRHFHLLTEDGLPYEPSLNRLKRLL